MSSGHGHGHGHGGPPANASQRRGLTLVLGISGTILVVEIIGSVISGSLALLADAGHMLTDVAGLSLALLASILAGRPATPEKTWGYQRAEVLAAAGQAAVLLAVGVFILVEGVQRLIEPPAVASTAMLIFGVVGLLGNAASILVLTRIQGSNMNTRAALLEVINDALGSLAVLVAAAIIALTGWDRADALASILIGVLILPRTWTCSPRMSSSKTAASRTAGYRCSSMSSKRVYGAISTCITRRSRSNRSAMPTTSSRCTADERGAAEQLSRRAPGPEPVRGRVL